MFISNLVILVLQHQNRWDDAADITIDATRRLEKDAADFAPGCTNARPNLYALVQDQIQIPPLAAQRWKG